MVEGVIALLILAALGGYGLLRLIDDCFDAAAEGRKAIADERAETQAQLRGLILDLMRLDDPIVRYEYAETIARYRGRS